MKKLISPKDEMCDDIIVLCVCGCGDHMLRISRFKDTPIEDSDFYASVIPTSWGLWTRFKYAWRMLWDGPQADEVIISHKEMKDFADTLTALVEEHP